MKRLKLLVLMIMAVLSLGALAAASASATERGVLLLEKEAGPVTLKGEGAIKSQIAVTGFPVPLICTGLKLLEVSLTLPGGTHFNLGKDGVLLFTGCKVENIACNTAGDEKEVLLLLVDVHLINLEEKAALHDGFAFLILNAKLELGVVVMKCGVTTIEVRGTIMGLVEPLAEKKITLVKDVTEADLTAKPIVCDKENETVCQELLEKDPLQADVSSGFMAATVTTTAFPATVSPMVLWDD